MWVRKRIDIGYSDIAWGLYRSCIPPNRRKVERRIEHQWSRRRDALTCLSVRSGFDLLLDALDFPSGSEILISALTIKDMVRIIEEHQCVATPVDLDIDTLAPKLDLLKKAITPRTKAIIVTHLFGGRVPLEPILKLAREHNLLVIEDCAQAYVGEDYLGHPESDVTMFSFGTIKTASALGGAILGVRNENVLKKMRDKQADYPLQGRWSYVCRLVKYAGVKALCTRPVLRVFVAGVQVLGFDYDRLANSAARGFAGPRFFERIRRQPSAPLLAVLYRRLQCYPERRLVGRTEHGQLLAELLDGPKQPRVNLPGGELLAPTFWVFPILSRRPQEMIDHLHQAGYDATQGASMWVVDPPEDRPDLEPHNARRFVRDAVYLPFYPQMPLETVRLMASCVIEFYRTVDRKSGGVKSQRVWSGWLRTKGASRWRRSWIRRDGFRWRTKNASSDKHSQSRWRSALGYSNRRWFQRTKKDSK